VAVEPHDIRIQSYAIYTVTSLPQRKSAETLSVSEQSTTADLEEKKALEINTIVSVLKQLDITGIQLMTMNANTLLALKELERGQAERRLA